MARLRTALLLALVGEAGVVVVEAQSMQVLMCKGGMQEWRGECSYDLCRSNSSSTGWCVCGVDDGCSCECPERGCKDGGDYPCAPDWLPDSPDTCASVSANYCEAEAGAATWLTYLILGGSAVVACCICAVFAYACCCGLFCKGGDGDSSSSDDDDHDVDRLENPVGSGSGSDSDGSDGGGSD